MAQLKRSSTILETAHRRLAGINSIDPNLDLGNGLTKPAFEAKVIHFQTRLDLYNQKKAELDAEKNGLEAEEQELHQESRRWLAAGEGAYGADSSEYEALGGTRTSERKKPRRGGGGGSASGGGPVPHT
jgi:hypothetical protein